MKYEREIKGLLRSLGVSGTYRGFDYTASGIALAVHNPDCLVYITKDLYPDVAKKYQTSWKCVERDIRTVIKVIWNIGDKELLEEIAGGKLSEKPGNREFIEMMAEYILKVYGNEAAVSCEHTACRCMGYGCYYYRAYGEGEKRENKTVLSGFLPFRPYRVNKKHPFVGHLFAYVRRLESRNREMEATIERMRQIIWDLLQEGMK